MSDGIASRLRTGRGASRGGVILRVAVACAGVAAAALVLVYDIHAGGSWGLTGWETLALLGGVLAWLWAFLPVARGPKVLLLGSTIAGLLAAEAALRTVFPAQFTTLYSIDDRCLHRYIPGAQRLIETKNLGRRGPILVRINADGYRGAPLRPRAAGAIRLAVFGDSFVAAEQTALDATFVARLEARLADALGRPVECVNAGVVAYGPDQECARMEEDLPRLSPDLAIVALYADNDFGDLLRNKMFRLSPDGALVSNRFTIGPALRGDFARARASRLWNLAQKSWWPIEAAINRLRGPAAAANDPRARMKSWLARGRGEFAEFALRGGDEVSNLFEDYYDADVSLEPESEAARYKTRLMAAIIARIGVTAARAGIPVAVVVIPSAVDLRDDRDRAPFDSTAYPAYRRSTLTDSLDAFAARSGIPSLNLYAPFRDSGPDSLYERAGGHWNDAGQDLAARRMAEFLIARGLVR